MKGRPFWVEVISSPYSLSPGHNPCKATFSFYKWNELERKVDDSYPPAYLPFAPLLPEVKGTCEWGFPWSAAATAAKATRMSYYVVVKTTCARGETTSYRSHRFALDEHGKVHVPAK